MINHKDRWAHSHLRGGWYVVREGKDLYALKPSAEGYTRVKKYGSGVLVCEAPMKELVDPRFLKRIFEWRDKQRASQRKAAEREAARREAERREAEARREAERRAEAQAAQRRAEIRREFEEVRGLFERSLEALDAISFNGRPPRRWASPQWEGVMRDVAAKNAATEARQLLAGRAQRLGLALPPTPPPPTQVAKILEVLENAGAREGDLVAFPKSVREAKRLASLVREKREEEAAFAAAFHAARSGADARKAYEALPMRIRQGIKFKDFLALVREREEIFEEWMRSKR